MAMTIDPAPRVVVVGGGFGCGIRRIADRIPTQAGQHSDDCGQPDDFGLNGIPVDDRIA